MRVVALLAVPLSRNRKAIDSTRLRLRARPPPDPTGQGGEEAKKYIVSHTHAAQEGGEGLRDKEISGDKERETEMERSGWTRRRAFHYSRTQITMW